MSKKSKKKRPVSKPAEKEPSALVPDNLADGETPRVKKEKPIIRAIRVTQEILDAAKEYKKAKGVSFYALGLEAISERLSKEGFLKKVNS